MAHFIGEISGKARTEASRLGSKQSGIQGHIRGWNLGVRVSMYHDAEKDMDIAYVWLTSGSNGGRGDKLIGEYTVKDLKEE